MRNYKNYQVWNEAHELTMLIYMQIAADFPPDEKFELKSQLKRAAYSIPFNIVEGCGRYSDKEFSRFLDMSLGSAHELEYCTLLGKDLKFIEEEKYIMINKKINVIKAMLINLIKSIRESKHKKTVSPSNML
jgi:four helix bundle protein